MNISNELYSKILPIINSIYIIFDFMHISKSEYNVIVEEEINNLLNDNYNEEKFVKLFEKNLYDRMIMMGKNLINNKKSAYKLIDSYIDYNFNNIKTVGEIKNGFRKLDVLLDNCDYFLDVDVLKKLINNNIILNRLLKEFFDCYSAKIINGKIDRITNSNSLKMMCEVYAIINGIEIYDENDDEEEYDFKDLDTEKSYIMEIKDIPLLSASEEKELARRASNGDEDAREKLIVSNLRLVLKYAFQYRGMGLTVLDLVQEGNIGLMKAVDEYDADKGFKLSTYASWWIRQSIIRAISNSARSIRLPVHLCNDILTCVRTMDILTEELGRVPTFEEIGERMGVSSQRALDLYRYRCQPLSLNAVINDEDETEMIEFVASEDEGTEDIVINEVVKSDLFERLDNLFDACNLSQKEKEILMLRNTLSGNGNKCYTLDELGEKYGVTRERIRQIEKKALIKIRNYREVKKCSCSDDFLANYAKVKVIKKRIR